MDEPKEPAAETPPPQRPIASIEPASTRSPDTASTRPLDQAVPMATGTTLPADANLSVQAFLYGKDSAFTPFKDRWKWACLTAILTLLACLFAYRLQYENLLGGTFTNQIKHARSHERLTAIKQRMDKQSSLDAKTRRLYTSLIALRRADLDANQLRSNQDTHTIAHNLRRAQFPEEPEYSLIVTANILDAVQNQTQLSILTPTLELLWLLERKLKTIDLPHAYRVQARLENIRQNIFFTVVIASPGNPTSLDAIAPLNAGNFPTHHPLHRLVTAAAAANRAEAFIQAAADWYFDASLNPPRQQLASLTLFPGVTLGRLFLTPTHFPDVDVKIPSGTSEAIALLPALRNDAFSPTPNIHEVLSTAHAISINAAWMNTAIEQKWLPQTVAAFIKQRKWSVIPALRKRQAQGPYKGAISWWAQHMADVQRYLESTRNPDDRQTFAAFSKQYDESIHADAIVNQAEQRAKEFIKAALSGTIDSRYLERYFPKDQTHFEPQQHLDFQIRLIENVFHPLLTYNGNPQQVVALNRAEDNLLNFIVSYLQDHLVISKRNVAIGREATHPLHPLKIDTRLAIQAHNKSQATLTLHNLEWTHLEDADIDWWSNGLLRQPYFALLQEVATCLWFAQQHELQQERQTLEVLRTALETPSLLCPGQLQSGDCVTNPYTGVKALALLIYRRLPLLVHPQYYKTWWITKQQSEQRQPAWMAFNPAFPIQLARTNEFTRVFGIAPSFHNDFFAALAAYHSMARQEIEQFSRTPNPRLSLPRKLNEHKQARFAYGTESTVGKGLLTLVESEAFLQAAIEYKWYPDQPATSFSPRSNVSDRPLATALNGQLEAAFRAVVPLSILVRSQEALQILRKLRISQHVLWWNEPGINALDIAHRARLYSFFLGMKYGRGKLWNNTPFDVSLYPNFDYLNAYQQNRQEIQQLVMDVSRDVEGQK